MRLDKSWLIDNSKKSSGIPVWEHMDILPEELLEKKDWNSIINYVSDNKDLVYDKWLREERNELNNTLNAGSFYLEYITEILKSRIHEHAILELGELLGTINLLKRIIYQEEQLEDSVNIAKKELSSIKHLDNIILLLESNGTLTHSSLAEKLDHMNASTLTENMKKIISRNLVYAQIYGRFKQYYLTDYGRAYAKLLRQKEAEELGIYELEGGIKRLLKDQTNYDRVQEMVTRIRSYMSEIKMDEVDSEVKNQEDELEFSITEDLNNLRWTNHSRKKRKFPNKKNIDNIINASSNAKPRRTSIQSSKAIW